MTIIDLNDLGDYGSVRDMPPYELPPEVASLAYNVRVKDRSWERMKGYSQTFGTPGTAPVFVLPLRTGTATFWLYMGLTSAWVYDGTNHTDITRAVGGAYTASFAREFNGTILGGIPIINNGVDVPQFWATPTIATDLANLTNWPATLRAKIIRALGPYLVAYNLTESGTNKPHKLIWSHPADPGSVPSSWDVTDETKDAGDNELPDVNSGIIVEALPLASSMFIYKESSIWRQTYIGGRFIFDFKTFSETMGALAARCVAMTGDGRRHVVLTQDDLIAHDGNTIVSLLDKKYRKTLFDSIDAANYQNTFLYDNPSYGEIWVCYPTTGNILPNRALIWNYRNPTNPIYEADCAWVHAAHGAVEDSSSETWDTGTDLWDDDTGPWSQLKRRRTILVGQTQTKFFLKDNGLTRDGASFLAVYGRESLGLVGKKRSGELITDFQVMKLLQKIWPKVRGGPVRVRLGSQKLVNGPITYKDYKVFNPSSMMWIDQMLSGRALTIEFSTTENVDWALDGYKLEFDPSGQF